MIRSIFGFAIIFSLIYFVVYVFRSTLFKSEYYIKNLNYSVESLEVFDDPVLYRTIKNQIDWENYYVLKFFKKKRILELLKSKFPIVKDIEFVYYSRNTLDVRVEFDDIDLRFKLLDNYFALYNWRTFLIYSWNSLWFDAKVIELPWYLSGLDNLNWLFFDYGYMDFILNIDIITQVFGEDVRLVYIPGSKRIAIFVNEKKVVYVNLQKDIKLQMTQYDFLRKYDENFAKYSQMDLGSLEWNMVIVKK